MWFEFYKLSLIDADLSDNIKKSSDFYKPWGGIQSVKFDDWWKGHSDLFGITKVEEIKRVSNHPNSSNISIPLNQTVTNSIKELRTMIEVKQIERMTELGIDSSDKKTTTVGFGH